MRARFLKHALAMAGALFFLASLAHAQTQTNVTATIVDPLGIPYANGTYSVQLIPAGTNPTVNGNSIGGAFNGRLDQNGSFNLSLWPNSAIVPGGTLWQFTICIPGGIAPPLGTGSQCTPPTAVTISGASQSLSATLSAVAPRLTTISLGAGTVTSVSATGPLVAVPNPITGVGTLSCPTCSIIGGTGVAGDTVYWASPAPTLAAGTVVLDMAGIAGADLGAKMNACVAQLPSNKGFCKGDNLTGAQTVSTALTVAAPKSVVFTFCGQAITISAAITGDGYSLVGCPSKTTSFTKSVNIDMVTISGSFQEISGITFNGNRPTNSGDCLVLNGAEFAHINDVVFNGCKGSSVNSISGLWNSLNDVKVFDFGDHAYLESGSLNYLNSPTFQDTSISAAATGTTIQMTGSESVFTGGYVYNSSGFITVNVVSESSPTTFTGIQVNNFGGFQAMVLANDLVSNVTASGGGASHVAITANGSQITNSQISGGGGSDAVTLNSDGRFEHNRVNFNISGVAGKCGVNVLGESIGSYVGKNTIHSTGTGSNPNYGVCLTTVAGQHTLDINVESNTVIWSDATNSAAVRFDNTANVGTNVSGDRFVNNNCIHIHFCVSRVDSGNFGINYYENNQGDPVATFDTGGSNKDVIVQRSDSVGITFAALPIAGNNSVLFCTDCTVGVPASGGGGILLTRINGNWQGALPTAAPTVSSGFGTGAAISVNPNGTTAFRLSVGTSNTGNGVIGLPTAKTGWNCYATDITTKSTTVDDTKQTASSATTATLQNYTNIVGTGAWVDNDVLAVSCFPF